MTVLKTLLVAIGLVIAVGAGAFHTWKSGEELVAHMKKVAKLFWPGDPPDT